MSRIEKSTRSNVTHMYHVSYPTTAVDVQQLADTAAQDVEAAGVEAEVEVWGDEHGLHASWSQNVELDEAEAMFTGPQCEVLAKALMSETKHEWDSTPEQGREHYRQKARAVFESMLSAKK